MAEPLVAADASLDEVRAFFESDRYATTTLTPTIEDARPGYARVSMEIGPDHRNGMGALMGGVSFTLADFAFAIASNVGQAPTVTASSTIDFMSAPKDTRLVAECEVEKNGRSLCFATVRVTDGAGNPVSRISVTGFRKG